MTRYYYDDPMAAVWQAEHFGMKFDDLQPSGRIEEMQDIEILIEQEGFVTGHKFYIHPDSLHLLEPQVDDLCECDHADYYADDYNLWCPSFCFNLKKVIQRNDIPFHWPKQEASNG